LIKKVEQLERKLCSLDLELTASNKNVELHKENLNELQHDGKLFLPVLIINHGNF